MRKKTTKALSMMLAAILACGSMAGCGKGKQVSNESSDAVNLSVFMHFMGYCVYDEEWPIFQKAAELTGVSLTGTASENVSDSKQAFNTMLASKKLPEDSAL